MLFDRKWQALWNIISLYVVRQKMAGIMEYYPDDFLKIASLLESVYVVQSCKIIRSHTTLNLLEVLIVFLATCFGSYTEPSSG